MLIEKDGRINHKVVSFLLKNNTLIELDENQFLQITPSGKKYELWEGKKEFLAGKEYGFRFISAWQRKSVIACYEMVD